MIIDVNTRFFAPWECFSSVRVTHLRTQGIFSCTWHKKQDWPVLVHLWPTKAPACNTVASSVLKSVGNLESLFLNFGVICDFVTMLNMSITILIYIQQDATLHILFYLETALHV